VEGLDAPSEHLRDVGELLDGGDLDPAFPQELRCPAAGDELDVELLQPAREVLEPGLVERGEQCAPNQEMSSRTVSGRSRCSTACTRARSVSTVSPSSTGTLSVTITGPVSMPSST
jgi:hypothetical protein